MFAVIHVFALEDVLRYQTLLQFWVFSIWASKECKFSFSYIEKGTQMSDDDEVLVRGAACVCVHSV